MTILLQELLKHQALVEGESWVRQLYSANQTIFRRGDPGDSIFLILSGEVRILGSVELNNSKYVHPGISELGPGEIFGELVLFDQQPRSASAMAVEDSELAIIDSQALLAFMDQRPDIGYSIMKDLINIVIGRLRKANRRMFSLFAWGLKSKEIDREL